MHNSDTDADVDQVMESAESVEPEQSESASLGASLTSRQGSVRRISAALVLLTVTSLRIWFTRMACGLQDRLW